MVCFEGRGERAGRCFIERNDIALERTVVVEVGAASDAAAINASEPRRERRGAGDGEGRDVPVRGRHKRDALALALDNQTDRGRLHTARREALRDLAPQHRRNLEAEEPVKDAAGFLCVDEVQIEVARLLDGGTNRIFGDLVEHHALDRDLGLENFAQVPGNGLTFAVLISREQEFVGVFQRTLQLGDGAASAVAGELVIGLESIVDVDCEAPKRALLHLGRHFARFWKVANVPHRAEYLIAVSEVCLDRLHLGW